MGYITQWDEFSVSAERLYLSSPLRTRMSFKYRSKEGDFVVKVTDNQKCLLFKSNQKSDLRKMEALNMRFLDLMSAQERNVDAEVETKEDTKTVASASNDNTVKN